MPWWGWCLTAAMLAVEVTLSVLIVRDAARRFGW
jgi:hypothetical protein